MVINDTYGSQLVGPCESLRECVDEARRYRLDLSHADLRSCDLRGFDLAGLNLQGAQLGCAQMECACLRGVNLRHAALRWVTFTRASLLRADMRWADVRESVFYQSDLQLTRLQGARLEWTSHDLLAEILLRAAGKDLAKRQLAGLVLVSRDWCWSTFLSTRHPLREWAVDVLARRVTSADLADAAGGSCGIPKVIVRRALHLREARRLARANHAGQ